MIRKAMIIITLSLLVYVLYKKLIHKPTADSTTATAGQNLATQQTAEAARLYAESMGLTPGEWEYDSKGRPGAIKRRTAASKPGALFVDPQKRS